MKESAGRPFNKLIDPDCLKAIFLPLQESAVRNQQAGISSQESAGRNQQEELSRKKSAGWKQQVEISR
jgi:hypothetical protein